MFSGYQNKKKKKELANTFEKLSKPGWKSTEKLDSLAKPRSINVDQQQHESDVSSLNINHQRQSLNTNSAKPNPDTERTRKPTSVYDGLGVADTDDRSLNTEKALPPNPDGKVQLDELDTKHLESNIARMAKEAGVDFDTSKLLKEENDNLDNILDQISAGIKEAYCQKINAESEKTAAISKGLKSLEDNNTWIKDTCSQITEKLQQLENEVRSEKMLETNRPQLRENLKAIVSSLLKPKDEDDTWIPKFEQLCHTIKKDSQQLRSDIHHLCKMFTDTSWEKELRKRTEKCFDIKDQAAFERMKANYTAMFDKLFSNYQYCCSDEYIITCSYLAKSYLFPPPSPKHLTTSATNTSNNSSNISIPEDSSKKSSPSITAPSQIYILKSKILPPLHFSNKERADMFLSNLGHAKAYYQTDAMHLYKSFEEHRAIKTNEMCSCILCEEASKHKHTTAQCNFCNVHQNHNKKNEQNQEHCTCGNCIHFSHYMQGLRFLTGDFADSVKYTASRSSSFQEHQQQQPTKEKKSLNKLIGGLLFDHNNNTNSNNSNKKK